MAKSESAIGANANARSPMRVKTEAQSLLTANHRENPTKSLANMRIFRKSSESTTVAMHLQRPLHPFRTICDVQSHIQLNGSISEALYPKLQQYQLHLRRAQE
uniref:Uncharacterized protein n=1 Tax=Steinernema glaseri TaxID=37863 RepID=A0A1I7ZA66_9BILA